VIFYREYTEVRDNDFTAHGYCSPASRARPIVGEATLGVNGGIGGGAGACGGVRSSTPGGGAGSKDGLELEPGHELAHQREKAVR
jgi:hypothetical protein